MNEQYIFEFKPISEYKDLDSIVFSIEERIQNKESIKESEINLLLDYLCLKIRKMINPKMDNFDYKCDLAQAIAYYYFKKLECNIYPAMTQNVIVKDIVGHSFLTVQFLVDGEIKCYLIDPTYIQFCKQQKCSVDNYIIASEFQDMVLLTPDPGFFILEKDKSIMNSFINRGYMELNEENARIYGDSFFNTKQGIFKSDLKFQTIGGSIYINSFLKANEPISKTERELMDLNLLINPISKTNNEYNKTL